MPLFPFISLAIYLLIWGLMGAGILPDISSLFEIGASLDQITLLILMGAIIFLESLIYLGFYLPGQFIAVILVIAGADSWTDLIPLTLVSITAVTLSALVNYTLGYLLGGEKILSETKIDWKKVLLSMIHINTLALMLFEAGRESYPKRIILLVGILNLPYYILILGVTYIFQDEVREVGENPYYLLIALILWCVYSLWKSNKRNSLQEKLRTTQGSLQK